MDKTRTPARVWRGLALRGKWSGFLIEFGFFDAHVFEFTGFEHLAAFETFHEFGVFLAGDDLHARVLTLCHGGFSREVAAVGLTS
jgi:hypothetical protein